MNRSDQRSMVGAFLVAAVVTAVLFAAFTFATDESSLRGFGYLMLLLLVGVASAFLAIMVFALPAFLLLARLRLVNLWSALSAGLIIGAIMAAMTEWPQSGLEAFARAGWNDHAVRRICVYAVIGAISALCFWLIWKRNQPSSAEGAEGVES